jgi:hypothetical protein
VIKTLKILLLWLLLPAAAAFAANAGEILKTARAAVEEKRYADALEQLARIQAFHYRDTEALPEALFYIARIYQLTEAPERSAQAVRELNRFYPESSWTLKANREISTDQQKKEFGYEEDGV